MFEEAMPKRFLFSLLCCTSPVAAFAQPLVGPYMSLGAGLDLRQNEDHRKLVSNDVAHQVTFHPGFAGQISAGYGIGYGLRLEIEGNFLDNVIRSEEKYPVARRAGGVEASYGGFANAIYDFNLPWPIQPYAGFGVGIQGVDRRNINNSSLGFIYPRPEPDQTNTAFAYQGIVGFAYPVSFLPGLSLTADYRFLGYGPLGKYKGFQYGTASTIDTPTLSHPTNDFNHIVMLGLRYALFQPAPPPPPMAAPAPPSAPPVAPARTYLVFFDWDRADLSSRARQIIAEAATASTHVQTTRIEVNGYTDLSGTPAYNQKLSVHRAQSVEAELVKDGVTETNISIHGYGESNPLVPTANGVREPQNRRVEIILK